MAGEEQILTASVRSASIRSATTAAPQGWSVGVIVPAQNEESTIERCIRTILSSLAQARVRNKWLAVVADACTDTTAARARRALGIHGEVVEIHARSAGAARRIGAASVLRHFKGVEPSRIWMANTDADTHVPDNWITVQLSLAEAGVTGVAGIVRLDSGGAAAAHEIHHATYEISPTGTHSHVHGANLSMRADAYLDVGGWSTLPLAEDHCIWRRLRHRGWRVSSPVESVVITSPRLEGRAPGGFADTLKARMQASHVEPEISAR
jgi:cellulose synthase/poly-beta-1,6-N-acetylglucosamine synthase-like glycosyltransferase